MSASPRIGIVGSQGAFGRWLRRFFEQRMGLEVIGRDPAGDDALSVRALIDASDVLIFSAPIRATVNLIRDYVAQAQGAEHGRLWLDITSIKAAPVAALLQSQAEVVGLHPMTAPPKTPTLQGRTLAVCAARLQQWRPWLEQFLAATEADCVPIEAEPHDRAMALVQGLVHATHMAQGAVLRELAPAVGGLAALSVLGTVGYELDSTVLQRILASNPAIYEDIQFGNPHVAPMLERLAAHIDALRDRVLDGSDSARAAMRNVLLQQSADFYGATALAEGSYAFERIGYLLDDLAQPAHVSVFLPQDRHGSLRALLTAFEVHGINLDSIHSSRSLQGELHFRLGLSAGTDPQALAAAVAAIETQGIGRVIDQSAAA